MRAFAGSTVETPSTVIATMPRFVVLRHETPSHAARESHWDLMLETGPTLRTWAVAVAPEQAHGTLIEALADHRLAYLSYEGPISEDRGQVTRWDQGTYQMVEQGGDLLVVEFHGKKLNGRAQIRRQGDGVQRWRLSFDPE